MEIIYRLSHKITVLYNCSGKVYQWGIEIYPLLYLLKGLYPTLFRSSGMEYLSNKKHINHRVRVYIRKKHGVVVSSQSEIGNFIRENYKPIHGLDRYGIVAWFARKFLQMAVVYEPTKKIKKMSEDEKRIYNGIAGISQRDDSFGWEKYFLTKEKYKEARDDFYKSLEWKRLRYEVLRESRGYCSICGRDVRHGAILHVDHIIPLSKDWTLRLDKNNLQVLCEDCNMGKLNTDAIDWRP